MATDLRNTREFNQATLRARQRFTNNNFDPMADGGRNCRARNPAGMDAEAMFERMMGGGQRECHWDGNRTILRKLRSRGWVTTVPKWPLPLVNAADRLLYFILPDESPHEIGAKAAIRCMHDIPLQMQDISLFNIISPTSLIEQTDNPKRSKDPITIEDVLKPKDEEAKKESKKKETNLQKIISEKKAAEFAAIPDLEGLMDEYDSKLKNAKLDRPLGAYNHCFDIITWQGGGLWYITKNYEGLAKITYNLGLDSEKLENMNKKEATKLRLDRELTAKFLGEMLHRVMDIVVPYHGLVKMIPDANGNGKGGMRLITPNNWNHLWFEVKKAVPGIRKDGTNAFEVLESERKRLFAAEMLSPHVTLTPHYMKRGPTEPFYAGVARRYVEEAAISYSRIAKKAFGEDYAVQYTKEEHEKIWELVSSRKNFNKLGFTDDERAVCYLEAVQFAIDFMYTYMFDSGLLSEANKNIYEPRNKDIVNKILKTAPLKDDTGLGTWVGRYGKAV